MVVYNAAHGNASLILPVLFPRSNVAQWCRLNPRIRTLAFPFPAVGG